MDVETKLTLALKTPVVEAVTQDELRGLFETNSKPTHYIGFETSGLLHLGSLLVTGSVINNLAKAGVQTQVFLADWHAFANGKLGGDWAKLESASRYFEQAFNFYCPKAKIRKGTELYHNNDDYWRNVVKFSLNVTIARATRTMQILGRSEHESLDVAKYIYPSMQGVDIKFLGADIAHAGMDQRKVHMLAREVFPKMGWKPPIALHHSLLPSLSGEEIKMSKSQPDTAIFIHDSAEEIKRKVSKAFCPEKTVEGNPVLEYAKFLFSLAGAFKVERPAKFGGTVEFESFEALQGAFSKGDLHPADLKNAVAASLEAQVAPIRGHFEKGRPKEHFEAVKSFQITR
ncbi:TPA: tyrosine--tRNA ligase [Candidatus Micrarchaeota archaeon]|nr:tyrosine--tRNA ligase [Candidatus Micrarchaeota archaeon]